MKKFLRRHRERQFLKAYRILRNEAERHRKADHIMEFTAVSPASITMRCTGCPDLHP